ncbi:MAG: hypothetical protein Q8L68_06470 [Methylococcales bacterium]|nr:hypothetical protein [Methylococcales bacterium]
MKLPSFDELALDRKSGKPGWSFCSGTSLHPNPYFYKYHWSIFWQGSPIDGRQFLDKEYWLCTHEAFTLIKQLHASNEFYWIYNRHRPRYDLINTPFDFNHPKWKNSNFAPSFEQDDDPAWISENGVSYK